MEKIITLKSREFNNYLKRLKSTKEEESTTYLLKVEHPNLWRTDDPSGKIVAIDPMGGPEIKVGEPVEGAGIVEFIDYVTGYGYTVTFKKDDMASNK